MSHALFNRCMNWQPQCYRLQNRWTFTDIDGNQWPTMFKTKRAAMEQGERHRDAVANRAMEEIRKERAK